MPLLSISHRGQNVIASPLRKFLPLMQAARKRGVIVYTLNTGDPDLPMPRPFVSALHSSITRHLNYAPSPGIPEHVAAWIHYYRQFGVNLAPEQIIPTVGGAEAILLALLAATDAGDEVIIFEPSYVSYRSFSMMCGITLVPVTLKTTNGFALPGAREIERRISRKTKVIVIINPDNPTGKLWSAAELNTILRIAAKRRLFVISDETYREIRFSGHPSCLLSTRIARDQVIVVDSVSKRFSMPGARIGCIASFHADLMSAVLKFAQARLSAGTLEQLALIPLLHHSRRYTDPIVKEYKRRRDVVYNALASIPGVVVSRPGGAFYLFARLPVDSAEQFVIFMIRDFQHKGQTVMVSPMQDFYITPGLGRDEIRIAYILNVPTLKKAMEVFKQGLAAYQENMRRCSATRAML